MGNKEPDDMYKEAYNEWQSKTDWVQSTCKPKELGMHRADVLRKRIEQLEAELAAYKISAVIKTQKPFPWGKVLKVHKIDGLPEIVEYIVAPEFEERGNVEFHIDTPISMSSDSLDEAIIAAICTKRGEDLEAVNLIWRLIGGKSE